MNIANHQAQSNATQDRIDYCQKTVTISGQEEVNNYRCNQRTFSASDLWRITRNKRDLSIRTNIQQA